MSLHLRTEEGMQLNPKAYYNSRHSSKIPITVEERINRMLRELTTAGWHITDHFTVPTVLRFFNEFSLVAKFETGSSAAPYARWDSQLCNLRDSQDSQDSPFGLSGDIPVLSEGYSVYGDAVSCLDGALGGVGWELSSVSIYLFYTSTRD
ncbi:hypothetical protein BDZ91DRAFT_827946 [Kalaharituber pfeilii]|nr:hypothetical protein BDZ91DRAFT_827946 [Kalaharituber pfeilii]